MKFSHLDFDSWFAFPPLIFSLMLPSFCHTPWLGAKKGSYLSCSQCRGWRTRRMLGGEPERRKNLRASLGSQVIKYPCWGGVLSTSKLPAAAHCLWIRTIRFLFWALLAVFPHLLLFSCCLIHTLFTTSGDLHRQERHEQTNKYTQTWCLSLHTWYPWSHSLHSNPSLLIDSQTLTLYYC